MLIVCFISSILYLYGVEKPRVELLQYSEAKKEINSMSYFIQGLIEYGYRYSLKGISSNILAYLAINPYVEKAIFVDSNNIIKASTQNKDLNNIFSFVDIFQSEEFAGNKILGLFNANEILDSKGLITSNIYKSLDSNFLLSVSAVESDQQGKAQFINSNARLFILYNYKKKLNLAIYNFLREILCFIVFFAIMFLILNLLIHRLIFARLKAVQRSISLFRNGDRQVSVADSGKDEVSELGQEINIFMSDVSQNENHLLLQKNELQLLNQKERENSIIKDKFIANVSHEFRTPLNAMVGMTELLMETKLTSEQLQYVKSFKNAGNSLLNIINDLLDLAKIKSDNVKLNETEFSLLELVKDLEFFFSQIIKLKKLHYYTKFPDALSPYYLGDIYRIRQILTNLISNAIKFTKVGSIEVLIEPFFKGEQEGVLIKIKDTGAGIPKDQIDKVFEPFCQADNISNKEFAGTGLGLTVCKNLCTLMKGSIELNSTLGEGTEVIVFLPLIKSIHKIESKKNHNLSKDHFFINGKNPYRVLIVDDTKDNRMFIRAYLGKFGFAVSEACAGDEALQIFSQSPNLYFDVVLMDLQMPRLNGIDATQKIRQCEVRKHWTPTSIVILSAFSESEKIAESLQAGANGYLVKPIQIQSLMAKLDEILIKKKS